MRTYLALAAREAGVPIRHHVLEAARRAIGEAVPVPVDRWRTAEWRAPGDGVVVLSWSNEPEDAGLPEQLTGGADRVLGYCGYLGDRKPDEDLLVGADDLGAAADTLGGVFSLFRADAGGFEAATSISRACPIYYAEAGGVRFAGSRAILVHLAARAAETGLSRPGPAYDVLGLHTMVRHGFFASEETPFQGVSALPNSGTLIARHGTALKVVERELPEQGPVPRSRSEARARIEPLAEALLAACVPFRQHDRPVQLALSGGRDSRLIAAALSAQDIPFVGATHGFADHPDVVLSKRVADALGAEWMCDFTERRDDDTVEVRHPVLRAHDIVRMCEGMNSAYERVNGWRSFDAQPRSSGSGGERLRGGFLTDQDDITPDGVDRRLKVIFAAQHQLLTPEANARAEVRLDHWRERARADGIDVLDKLHMFYRTGRWLAGSHTATLMNWCYYHPFLDARVVREALALPAEWRYSEEPVYLLLERLAPQLGHIPFDGKRWRFDRSRPRLPWKRREWEGRAPMLPAGGTSGFNWRRKYGPELATVMREQILSSPAELWDIADRKKIEPLLDQIPPKKASQSWHLLTLSVLLSNIWREPAPDLPRVSIPIPR
ncbi:asparagine synthase-related protein [Actinomadura alba]|uniref:Asparagine synthetase domain-containing protein n=1 Tax=Actinomadura alba TaxID=406431 RepID=A0ABR7LSL9_9ACTN|nr:asparagine synthase-related protein [Actinomadura alba]MBC6467726.1 hypothetical protein [Actinomadura alba]